MRQRVLGLALGLSLFALVLSRLGGSEPAPSASAPLPRPTPEVEPLPAVAPAGGPTRNLFEYASESPQSSRPAASPGAPAASVAPASPPAEALVRLVGFVRQSGTLKAALALPGEVAVVGVGETVQGYQVLALDEDAGVRLRAPDGVVSILKP